MKDFKGIYPALLTPFDKNDKINEKSLEKMRMLMTQSEVMPENRKCAVYANAIASQIHSPVCAIELNDGHLVRGKTSSLLRCSSAALLNALKYLAGIDPEAQLISPDLLNAIHSLKNKYLNLQNPLLDIDEVLLTLSIAAANDENAKKCLEALPLLKGCEIHCTIILAKKDTTTLRNLNMNLTCDPKQGNA